MLDAGVVRGYIASYSASYALTEQSQEEVLGTLQCESRFNASAVGDHGTSFGIAQIHLSAHPTITKAQALDPEFAIQWTVQQFAAGRQSMWSCYKIAHGWANG